MYRQHFTEYDLYLMHGCNTLPALTQFKEQVPVVAYPAFQQWIVTRQAKHLGFLRLDLPRAVAQTLLCCLEEAGALGIVLPAVYRQPKISREVAQTLAEREIEQLRALYFPTYSFGPVTLYVEQPRSWTYTSSSQKLIQEGYMPGALFADVDKLDGHIWTPEELEADDA